MHLDGFMMARSKVNVNMPSVENVSNTFLPTKNVTIWILFRCEKNVLKQNFDL